MNFMTRFILAFVISVGFPIAAYSEADGSLCPSTSQPPSAPFGSGNGACIEICSTHVEADLPGCDEFMVGNYQEHWFEYISRDGCSATPTVLIEMSQTPGASDRAVIGTLNAPGDIIQLTQPPARYITATISDDTGCTDLDVYYTFYGAY